MADPAAFRSTCLAVAQSLATLPPQVGILVAGGNPVLGSHSVGGLRLGRYMRTDVTLRLGLVGIHTPGLRATGTGAGSPAGSFSIIAPAISGDLALGIYPGVSLSPRAGGVGSVDLLGSVSWLPFQALGTDRFERAGSPLALGVGARVGLLREGFTTPGISLSLMHHRVGQVAYGQVCPGESRAGSSCARPGDVGELDFYLRGWSGRAVIGRRFVGAGIAAGAGYDRFTGEGEYAVRVSSSAPGGADPVLRAGDLALREGRWSLFTNLSYTLLLFTVAAEAGWMQGGSPLPGFEQIGSDFRPGRGTLFGGVGGRIAF
ncbi:MAG TPA: hypothetical protein VGR27_13305 [Longimicrobiaceae bacterium]|nr:hypothetical protein [Longimicrobiaceae bacterium]